MPCMWPEAGHLALIMSAWVALALVVLALEALLVRRGRRQALDVVCEAMDAAEDTKTGGHS